MVKKEQVKPLAPVSDRQSSDNDDEETATHNLKKTHRRSKYIKCCSCVATLLFILAGVAVILILTVFKVKDPVINLNAVQVTRLDLMNGTNIPRPGTNMSLSANISVKNPNYSSFKYSNYTSTRLYYRGTMIGEARVPPGISKARRTMKMNVTMNIVVDSLLGIPNLENDISSGMITLSSYTSVGGRVKIFNFIRKHVTVRMNCTMTINIISRAIEEQKCKKKVKV